MKTVEVKIDEDGIKRYFYLGRYITLKQAKEDLGDLKPAFDSIVKKWDGEMTPSRKIYLKSFEEKINLLTKILEHE